MNTTAIPETKRKVIRCALQYARIFFLWGLLPVILFCMIALGGAYGYYLINQERILLQIQTAIEEETKLPVTIKGPAAPEMFPPGVVVRNIALQGLSKEKIADASNDTPLVSIGELRARLDVKALFSGRVRLDFFDLDSVAVYLAYGKSGTPLWQVELGDGQRTLDSPHVNEASGISQYASGTAPVNPKDSSLPRQKFQTKNERSRGLGPIFPDRDIYVDPLVEKTLQDLEGEIRTQILFLETVADRVRIKSGSVVLLDKRSKLSLQATTLQAEFRRVNGKSQLTLSGLFFIPAADMSLNLSLFAIPGEKNEILQGELLGTLEVFPYQSPVLTGSFSFPFAWKANGHFVSLTGCKIQAESDKLEADFYLDIGNMTATGVVNIEELSLSRWFAFSRNLPSGIQRILHSLKGRFDLLYDGKGVHAYNLDGTAAEVPLTAYVGVENLQIPIVRADIALKKVDVDLLLPVLATEQNRTPEPPEPAFAHPPLAPYPEKPLAPGEEPLELIDVGYDIRIFADEACMHSLDSGPVQVLVQPMQGDICRVSFVAEEIAQGTLTGWLDIDRPLVAMHFEPQRLNLALLPENRDSSVLMEGFLTGTFDLKVPVSNGSWGDDWQMVSLALVENFGLASPEKENGWHIRANKVEGYNQGVLHAVRKDGISITGDWQTQSFGVSSSWNPLGKEEVSAKLHGTVAWPKPAAEKNTVKSRSGIDRVYGALEAVGSLTARLGATLVPIKGVLHGDLDWRINEDQLLLSNAILDGLGSYTKADIKLLFTPTDVIASATADFKLAPRALLKEWDLLPAEGVLVPEVITGTSTVYANGDVVRFDPLVMQSDGAPLRGSIICSSKPFSGKGISGLRITPTKNVVPEKNKNDVSPQTSMMAFIDENRSFSIPLRSAFDLLEEEKTHSPQGEPKKVVRKQTPAFWTISLTGSYVDFDKIIPPTTSEEADLPPSSKPWALGFLDGLNMDILLTLDKAKYQHMHLKNSRVTAKVVDKHYSFLWDTQDYYGGKALFAMEGRFNLPSEVAVSKAHLTINDFALDKALYDYNQSTSYGGQGNFVADVTGRMQSNADFPAGLSGTFALGVSDGLYPSFIGSENSGLRNTFSIAKLSGMIDKGIMRWSDFKLTGPVVDMTGEGWVDFPARKLDVRISARFVKIPTIPVRISGDFRSPLMYVRGVHMVLQTAQAAGVTVIDIFQGILELPMLALQGVGELFNSSPKKEAQPEEKPDEKAVPAKPKKTPKTQKYR